MIRIRNILNGDIRTKWRRDDFDAGFGPFVPFGALGVSPIVSQYFTTNPTLPAWLDVSGITGNRTLYDSTGKLTYAPNNLLINTATLSTQTATVVVGVAYIVSFYGTGSVALSGAATATINGTGVNDRVYQKVTATTTSLVLTVTGSVTSAQLEAVTYQTVPASYVATTAAAYYGPRFDYDPATLAARGLLIEESRQNLFLNSASLTSASWSRAGATVSANAFDAVTGLTTGTIFTCSAILTSYILGGPYTVASGATVTNSFILKNTGTNGSPYMSIFDTAHRQAQFILSGAGSTANADAGVTASIKSLGNGFYLCSLTYTITGTTVYGTLFISGTKVSNSATIGQTLYADRGQLEVGPFSTSYIPTGATSTPRAADIIKLSGAALSAIGGSSGTVIEEIVLEGNKAATQYAIYGNTVSPGYFTNTLAVSATNGTNVLASGQTAVVGTAGRIGFAWDASGRAISYSASTAVTDANAYGAIGSTVYLGSNNGATAANGWVRALSFYGQRLPNTTLAAKTTVGGPL